MLRAIYMIEFVFAFPFLQAQQSIEFIQPVERRIAIKERTIFYDLDGNNVPIKIQQYGERTDVVLINLHDDEFTSVEAVKRILQEFGGTLIEIENNGQRNIRFRLGRYYYKVDPNAIFSKEGIKTSLEQYGRTSNHAINGVEKLGQRIIQLIPGQVTCVIALHNNTEDYFSAIEYTPGGVRAADARKVFINNEQDADDFFLTTDHSLYEKLADEGFNTILQDNSRCKEDGSLSVYCGKKVIRYVNCETEHGKSEQYYQMMKVLVSGLLPK